MKTLSRYILVLYLKLLVLCGAAFASIYIVVDFLETLRRFSDAHLTASIIFRLFLNKLPDIAGNITPMATLLATLLTLGLLGRNNELTAMRSCGLSMRSIVLPILAAALCTSLLMLASNELVMPRAFQKTRYIEEVELKGKGEQAFFRQNNIWYRQGNLILQAKLFDPATMTLKGVTLWETGEHLMPVKRFDAAEGAWNGETWLFRQVTERELSGGQLAGTRRAAERSIPLALKVDDLKKISKYADEMSFLQLRAYCRKLSAAGYDAGRYLADMHAKLSAPFASLVMAVLAIPFAFRGGRSSGTAFGVAQSLGIGLAYFVTSAMMLSMGHSGSLPPLAAAWGTNILFFCAGAWLATRSER
ncbi:MAG TPA: LPS export ABC transporter permease LptG [Verrucomicrobiae bacterium]|nr:LPS export ABC transporter permease LptG [Verrucomicrobiae bacterium]